MVQLSALFIGLVAVATSTQAAPLLLEKRIAQTISASTAKWVAACNAAGGGAQCSELSVTAFTALLIAGGPCDQQNAADAMVTLGKTLKSNDMVTLAQIFAQQPRNTPESLAVPYCQTAPKNTELNGLFQCQFQGANQNSFVGGTKLGQPGTIPFGRTTPLSPLGSCPANPTGPIADGTQLSDIASSPGVPGDSGSASTTVAATTKAEATTSAAVSTAAPPAATTAAPSGSSKGFALANGQDAQQLNKKFAGLTKSSTCEEGENACVEGGFAQCIGGTFSVTACSGGLQCFALPLVNSRGTSITCDTAADAETRIANTGATGGLTGDGASAPASSATSTKAQATEAVTSAPPAATTDSKTGSTGFALANGQDAQALNKKFAALTAASACTDGETACVSGGFAQCVDGKFTVTACAGEAKCFALPLVNSRGTSITCDTAADATSRIANTGATGGLTGGDASAPAPASTTKAAATATSAGAPAATTAAKSSFALANGQDAQALNKKFAALTKDSACTDGETACVSGGFAQCVGGKFTVTACAGEAKCFALPLVNSRGTSITCDTAADATTRIANTGATGGLTA